MSGFVFGNRSRRMLYGTEERPGVKPIVVSVAVTALKVSTVDFGVIDGYRLTEDQIALYKEKRTTLDGINKKSDHQSGYAIDVIPVVRDEDGNKLNPFDVDNIVVRLAWMELYRAFMRAGMKHKAIIEFGFGYNVSGGRDYPHISIKGKYPKKR